MLMLLSTLLATSMLQRFGDLLVGGIMLALVAYGAQSGLFLAVLAGMHALVSLVVALAFAEPLAALLTTFELPAHYAFPAAFGLLLVGTAFGIRLLVGEYVPADVVRFVPPIDKVGGGLVGAVAGMVVAGTFLIACSIAPLPEAFRLDGATLRYDMGTRLLKTFARCVQPDDEKRAILLDGEPGSVPSPLPVAVPESPGTDAEQPAPPEPTPLEPTPPAPPPPPPPPVWSEPFADLNGNKTYDEGEPYIDTDTSQTFTARLVQSDVNGNGRRDIGLLERYRMHAWGQQVMSLVTIDEVVPAPAVDASAPAAGVSAPAAASVP
jgi:hypothetical protein